MQQTQQLAATINPAIKAIAPLTTIECNESEPGEPIERKVERIMSNQEPITDGAPTIYTERKDGVIPEYDIRSDRFDMAIGMTDAITAQKLLKRKTEIEAREKTNETPTPAPPEPGK